MAPCNRLQSCKAWRIYYGLGSYAALRPDTHHLYLQAFRRRPLSSTLQSFTCQSARFLLNSTFRHRRFTQ